MLRVVALVVAWAIPAPLEGMVSTALGHALGHELVRRRARRQAEADRWCLHRRVSLWARCSSRAGCGLFAFAVRPRAEAVGVPGAALIRAPLHRAAMDGTPARVGVVGGLQRWWGGGLPRAIPRRALGGLGLQGGRHGRGDLLVEAA